VDKFTTAYEGIFGFCESKLSVLQMSNILMNNEVRKDDILETYCIQKKVKIHPQS